MKHELMYILFNVGKYDQEGNVFTKTFDSFIRKITFFEKKFVVERKINEERKWQTLSSFKYKDINEESFKTLLNI